MADQKYAKAFEMASDLISAMVELQKVASDAGKPHLVWTVFEELMCISSRIKAAEIAERERKERKCKVLNFRKGAK